MYDDGKIDRINEIRINKCYDIILYVPTIKLQKKNIDISRLVTYLKSESGHCEIFLIYLNMRETKFKHRQIILNKRNYRIRL